jgi:hypothetical protein
VQINIGAWRCWFLLFCFYSRPGAHNPRTGGTLSVVPPDFFGIGEELAIQLKANLRPSRQQPATDHGYLRQYRSGK